MVVKYRLPPELRVKLKKPIGTLIRGPFNKTSNEVKEWAEKEDPPVIISVGDVVSKNLTQNNMKPKLSIVDNKVMRRKIQPISLAVSETLHAKNPPGTITEEAQMAIKEGLDKPHRVKLTVDGEEDLLTLPAILYAPKKAFVVYGQPFKGMVVVLVSNKKKGEVREILNRMKEFSKS